MKMRGAWNAWRRIRAIAGQTALSAVRHRVVLAGAGALLLAVAALPFLVKHNGTARMFAQVLITYNLSVITGLLGCLTLWLACGAVAGEIESGQLLLVAVKPVRRWELWLGKWLGVLAVDAALLLVSLTGVWALLHARARELPPEQRRVLVEEVLVARASVREAVPDLRADIEALVARRMQQPDSAGLDAGLVREQMEAFARARHETVAPNYRRIWSLDVGADAATAGRPVQLRVRFHAAGDGRETAHPTVWNVGRPGEARRVRLDKQLSAGVVHEFGIPAECLGPDGRLEVECENRGESTLLFRLEDGVEILHATDSFGANLVRGAIQIGCWLALLAAIGLAASSCFSFPTAVLASACLLYLGSSGSSLAEIVEEGTVFGVEEVGGAAGGTWIDRVAVPVFRAASRVVEVLTDFSPVSDLGSGRVIGWGSVAGAVARVALAASGLFAGLGMVALRRRQLGLPTEGA